MYDKDEEEVLKFNDYFFELFNSKGHSGKHSKHHKSHHGDNLLSKRDIEEGFSEFFVSLPDIEADYPHLPNLLSDLMFFVFIDKNIADFSKVEVRLASDELEEDEEPIYLVDIFVKVFGSFLGKIEERMGEEKLNYYYSHFNIKAKIDTIREYVDEDVYNEIQVSQNVLTLIK